MDDGLSRKNIFNLSTIVAQQRLFAARADNDSGRQSSPSGITLFFPESFVYEGGFT